MKTLSPLLLALLLVPVAVSAAWPATLGLFFDQYNPSEMTYDPQAIVVFRAYLYLMNAQVYVTGIEYQLIVPTASSVFWLEKMIFPSNAISIGDPFSGHSLAYWPPLNGYSPGFNLMCTFEFVTDAGCLFHGGLLIDTPLIIGPHPETGRLRGTATPNNDFFPVVGMTSLLCPVYIGTTEVSWGAIKSLYR
jgi:hypothetical protein